MRIGLYGGCFNPVHQGHLAAARGAIAQLGLDSVLFIPSGHPPLKGATGLAGGAHRVAMLQLAVRDEPRMAVSRIEIDREGPSFTVETVRALQQTLPSDAEIFFLLGDDCLHRLPGWKGIEELHTLLRFAILPRHGHAKCQADARLVWLETPPLTVSSTQIRTTFADGDCPPESLLPAKVADYIRRNTVYPLSAETAVA